MATQGKFIARTLRDVTRVSSDELANEVLLPIDGVLTPVQSEFAPTQYEPPQSQVICIASGKGGTGKSIFTVNLGVSLAREGLKVLIFDADLGLANAHVLLGAYPEYDISAVFSGEKRLSDIIVNCFENVRLISGGSGFSSLAELKYRDFHFLAEELKVCEQNTDIVLVDLSAGISPQVMRFLKAAHDIILITTPDVTAMLDAYATIKSLINQDASTKIKIVVNRAKDRTESVAVFKKIQSVAQKNLGDISVSFFGWIPRNWYVEDSVAKRYPLVLLHPRSFTAGCFRNLASRVKNAHIQWKSDVASAEEKDALLSVMSFSSILSQVIFT